MTTTSKPRLLLAKALGDDTCDAVAFIAAFRRRDLALLKKRLRQAKTLAANDPDFACLSIHQPFRGAFVGSLPSTLMRRIEDLNEGCRFVSRGLDGLLDDEIRTCCDKVTLYPDGRLCFAAQCNFTARPYETPRVSLVDLERAFPLTRKGSRARKT
jgi:hypothetical protein